MKPRIYKTKPADQVFPWHYPFYPWVVIDEKGYVYFCKSWKMCICYLIESWLQQRADEILCGR